MAGLTRAVPRTARLPEHRFGQHGNRARSSPEMNPPPLNGSNALKSSRRPRVAAFPEPDVRTERNRKLTRRMDHAIPVWLPDHAVEVSTVPKRAAGPGSLKQDLNSSGDDPKRL